MAPAKVKVTEVVQNGRGHWLLHAWQVWKNLVGSFVHSVQCEKVLPPKTDGRKDEQSDG